MGIRAGLKRGACLFALTGACLILAGCPLCPGASYTSIAVTEAHDLWRAGVFFLDVRSEMEFAGGHIPGAYNIDYTAILGRLGEIDHLKNAPIVVYCQSGGRSVIAAATLAAAGFTQVDNMTGGFDAWLDAGYENSETGGEGEGEGEGEDAPALQIAEWIRGGPVDVLDGQHIYVIEFFLTTCGGCQNAVPHMTELNHAFQDKGVVVAAISTQDAAVIRQFVTNMGDQLDYAVARDDNFQTATAYGVHGVPRAFVIDQAGHIVWDGNPMLQDLEDTLTRLTAA